MTNRLLVHLTRDEREALVKMAEQDFRLPGDQVRLLVAREAERRGLLPKMNDCAVTVLGGTDGAIVAGEPLTHRR